MNTFSLEILASDKQFFSGRAASVVLPAPDGGVQILAHHENMIIAVVPGTVEFVTKDGESRACVVSSGFAEVINNRVRVMVLTAERPEDIDIVRAREAQERAREQLRQKMSIQEYHLSKMSLARAMSRLSAATKMRDHN